jgi:hypothetical protein
MLCACLLIGGLRYHVQEFNAAGGFLLAVRPATDLKFSQCFKRECGRGDWYSEVV